MSDVIHGLWMMGLG